MPDQWIVRKGLNMNVQRFFSRDLDSPIQLTAGEGRLHVWLFSLEDYEIFKKDAYCLSEDERTRADRYARESDRKRYITGHIALRRLLGFYLHSDPETFTFQVGAHGKPDLLYPAPDVRLSEQTPHHAPIHFNISHSADLVALAFCFDSPVGIDIESIKDSAYIERIIRRFFHPSEYAFFSRLEDKQKKKVFFRSWTAREAFLKALGTGFSVSPDSFCIEPVETETFPDSGLYQVTKSREDYTPWRIQSVPAPADYMCSVAYLPFESQTP